jgi:dihydroorotate dehydrogenase subfamily 2
MLYKHIIKPILFLFDPERVHTYLVNVGCFLGAHTVTRNLTRLLYDYRGKDISKTVDGLTYRTPILLSAGFDYNGHLTRILPSLGFGGVEVGSVTARPCVGNTRPTLTRLPKSQAILVNKGLKNDGVDVIIKRLQNTPREKAFVIGISIAKTNDMQCADTQGAIEDYCYSFKRLLEENVGDYYTLNISCPNAFGGETFTTPERLDMLLTAIRAIPCSKPVYIKMPINLPWEETSRLLDVSIKHRVNGVIIGNLNKEYQHIDPSERPDAYRGGISGKPCFSASNALIEKTKATYGDQLTIIGCGGIFTPEDAQQKMALGSSLLQVITGMIYNGPGVIKKMCTALRS